MQNYQVVCLKMAKMVKKKKKQAKKIRIYDMKLTWEFILQKSNNQGMPNNPSTSKVPSIKMTTAHNDNTGALKGTKPPSESKKSKYNQYCFNVLTYIEILIR